MFRYVPLNLPDIHVVKLDFVAGLYLDLLSYFAIGIDPETLNAPKMVLKWIPSGLKRLSRASIISR